MRSISHARIDAAGNIILEVDDGAQLQLPLNLLVTLSAQARRLLMSTETIMAHTKNLGHAPIRADTVAVEIDDTDLDVVLVRLDPDSTVELPVRLSDKTASHLVDELARVLQHKATLHLVNGRPPYHS